ncbi:uncharacterized protein EV422DRAFT_233815 [Fimicolochytrium jonesii]|uniref:uncharacterized protein n=1 Tax=Fimicolochytrium jonesii TaxID=1396493 RepID=UPI0022FE1F59|nr:uncharacterized protein EV422DRAFT_233815 [Fimicolochytrium jonesii]KAI8824802.1 hypothetical protein EV422DRAFT_233815 [Fimicolochytrium jonesii]
MFTITGCRHISKETLYETFGRRGIVDYDNGRRGRFLDDFDRRQRATWMRAGAKWPPCSQHHRHVGAPWFGSRLRREWVRRVQDRVDHPMMESLMKFGEKCLSMPTTNPTHNAPDPDAHTRRDWRGGITWGGGRYKEGRTARSKEGTVRRPSWVTVAVGL